MDTGDDGDDESASGNESDIKSDDEVYVRDTPLETTTDVPPEAGSLFAGLDTGDSSASRDASASSHSPPTRGFQPAAGKRLPFLAAPPPVLPTSSSVEHVTGLPQSVSTSTSSSGTRRKNSRRLRRPMQPMGAASKLSHHRGNGREKSVPTRFENARTENKAKSDDDDEDLFFDLTSQSSSRRQERTLSSLLPNDRPLGQLGTSFGNTDFEPNLHLSDAEQRMDSEDGACFRLSFSECGRRGGRGLCLNTCALRST